MGHKVALLFEEVNIAVAGFVVLVEFRASHTEKLRIKLKQATSPKKCLYYYQGRDRMSFSLTTKTLIKLGMNHGAIILKSKEASLDYAKLPETLLILFYRVSSLAIFVLFIFGRW
ncbi:hypothetical protein QE152_g29763 [Popillia japonica]|uniref:Uncharacterized protein n=1 Tax=Popillia japonica TaxID=7064 RepID=A0AAW1JG72_POPJA